MSESDLQLIEEQPLVKLWGEGIDEVQSHKVYKGKFVVTDDRRLFAKLYPKSEWDNIELFHDMVVKELGIKEPESMDVKEVIVGGGKIEIELIENHVECRLYGKSTIYGDYESGDINVSALENEIRETFDLDEMPVSIVPDFEE